jgi:translation initiation factor 2 beta subunit (eIF-2beta)/eIF-5
MSEVNSTFFSKLKSVCRDVEQGISQLQNEVETKTSSRSNGNAVIKLTNIKQEIQDMKVRQGNLRK